MLVPFTQVKEREPLVSIKIDGSGELGNKAEEAVQVAKDDRDLLLT